MVAVIRRVEVAAALLLALAAAPGCAPIHVHAYAERGVSWTFRTYAWAPDAAVATGDPRLDNNRFFIDQVRASVDRELAARGFELAPGAAPDVLVHFHASITQEIEIAATDRFEHCYNCGATIYDAGTLVIDLVDARTSRLAWRGWVEKLNPVIDNQDWMDETIDWAVARIMKQLPPRT
jgi:uncharacterized protein DUF4136